MTRSSRGWVDVSSPGHRRHRLRHHVGGDIELLALGRLTHICPQDTGDGLGELRAADLRVPAAEEQHALDPPDLLRIAGPVHQQRGGVAGVLVGPGRQRFALRQSPAQLLDPWSYGSTRSTPSMVTA